MEWITIAVLGFDAVALAFVVGATIGSIRGVLAEQKAARRQPQE